jgi:hypothetical protein
LHGAGKYEDRKFYVPARCAGWLQGLSLLHLYVGGFKYGFRAGEINISEIPPK